jgi:hypothetical protein
MRLIGCVVVLTGNFTLACADAFAEIRNAGSANWKKYFTQGMRFFGISISLAS